MNRGADLVCRDCAGCFKNKNKIVSFQESGLQILQFTFYLFCLYFFGIIVHISLILYKRKYYGYNKDNLNDFHSREEAFRKELFFK